MSLYHADRYVDERMVETREKSQEYHSTLSCRFGTNECLR
jgi:hypothetical protein